MADIGHTAYQKNLRLKGQRMTRRFTMPSQQLAPTERRYTYENYYAPVCGFYFEAAVMKTLKAKMEAQGLVSQFNIKYDGNHNRAIAFFRSRRSSRLEPAVEKSIKEMETAIHTGANIAADNFINILKKEIKKITEKEINITLDFLPAADLLGDLVVTLNNTKIIIETKWQMFDKSGSKSPVRWATIVDPSLFGDRSFAAYVSQEQPEKYWNYTRSAEQCQSTLSNPALSRFLDSRVGSIQDQITLLVDKGYKGRPGAAELDTDTIKYVVHGTRVGVSIQTTERMIRRINDALSDTPHGAEKESYSHAFIKAGIVFKGAIGRTTSIAQLEIIEYYADKDAFTQQFFPGGRRSTLPPADQYKFKFLVQINPAAIETLNI